MAVVECWQIKDWNEVFEDYRSREVARLRFALWPLDRKSEACALLMQSEKGIFAFGVFARLVEVAARGNPRGVLRDEKGPLTPPRLAVRTGISAKHLERAICILKAPDCGWLIPWSEDDPAHRPRTDTRTDGAPMDSATCAGARARLTQPNRTNTPTGTDGGGVVVQALKARGVVEYRKLVEGGVTLRMIDRHPDKRGGVLYRALETDLADGLAARAGAENIAAWLESRSPEERDELARRAIEKLPAESPFRDPAKVERTRTWKNVVAQAMAGGGA